MAKKNTSRKHTTAAPKTGGKATVKAWHIFHFEQRYELPEDMRMCRKSGLQYSRDFVGVAAGDEAAGYHKQFGLLCNGDGFESCMLFGLYRRLVNLAAEQSRAKRGYLIDAEDRPLTAAQIGKLVHIPAADMRKLLKRFANVKLLEQVDLPQFDMTRNKMPPRGKGDEPDTPGNSGKKQAPSRTGKTGKTGKGKKNEHNGSKDKPKDQRGITRETGTEKRKNPGRAQKATTEAQTAQQQVQAEPEPENPTNPDALGQCKATRVAEPVPGSVKQPQAHRRSGSLSSAAQYDRHDMVFGRSIFIALRLAGDPDNGAIDETTSFASTWHKIQQQSCRSPPEIDQLAMRLRKEAQMIARRPSARNKAAVWNNTAPKIAAAQTTKHRQ